MLETKTKVINYLKKNQGYIIIGDNELSSNQIIEALRSGIFHYSFVSKILLNK